MRRLLRWCSSGVCRLTLCGQQGKEWDSPRPRFRLAGLEFASSRVGGSFLWNLSVPYRVLVPLLALPPVLWLAFPARRLYVLRRRRRLGLCPSCGYDLRASPERCPECGAACEAAGSAGESPAGGACGFTRAGTRGYSGRGLGAIRVGG